ncbi:restriction endonuclease PLD domain-containing protein [Providencia sp. PROV099]|uniref:restriction endonuclease PLD domain-containing protein n=3 Tax=unclassified Providencia TaxID=2633465 RepID=UPI00234AF930|nr:restriction endonuclease PLD domain-containing protein [Providencia sp. PROV099]WOB97731.1 NgoFVII family restriction endonuclease [Providencia sp. PROV099]
MLYTNLSSHGGNFDAVFFKQLELAKNVRIASGYFSLDILKKYENLLLEKANQYQCQILLGMAFYEGLSKNQFDSVSYMNNEMLKMKTNSGFFVTNGRKYHGKIFQLNNSIYIGSSNFSSSGFKGNIEATIKCTDEQKYKINDFLNALFSKEHSIRVDFAQIPIKGNIKLIGDKSKNTWEALRKHTLNELSPEINLTQKVATFDLLELAEHEKSNLNIFFGKGRENKKTKIVTPRPWYEFEIIAGKKITNSKDYPVGDFLAYTDDGYIIPMKTSGDYNKNLRSKGGLQVFGRWFKGRLEDAGVLDKFNQITPETILEYGKTKLVLYKMEKENCYYMKWDF